MSKTTQNELLHCIGLVIQHKIVKKVHQQCDFTRNFYGIQADEVTNMSNWEQLGIRGIWEMVSLDNFIDCESVSGENICENIIQS